jgi:DNA-directed RNA polymerase specialized sigma24 family protein
MPMSVSTSDRRVTRLANPALRASLSAFVRARVPGSEVDDIVQSALAEALAAERAPEDDDEVVAWVHGIARHKVVDWFRRARRESPQDPQVTETVAAADSSPQSARDLLRWAAKELPNGDENARTFEWMLREGAGEKLESIAADARLPAPRVRQRVSRLRKHYRARWAATLAALVLIAIAVGVALRKRPKEEIAPLPSPLVVPSSSSPPLLPPLAPGPEATPEERAAELRRDAFDKCAAGLWQDCLDAFDGAQSLDPAGDSSPAVQAQRKAAQHALAPAPAHPAPTKPMTSEPAPAPTIPSLQSPAKKKPAPTKTPTKTAVPSDWSSDDKSPPASGSLPVK